MREGEKNPPIKKDRGAKKRIQMRSCRMMPVKSSPRMYECVANESRDDES